MEHILNKALFISLPNLTCCCIKNPHFILVHSLMTLVLRRAINGIKLGASYAITSREGVIRNVAGEANIAKIQNISLPWEQWNSIRTEYKCPIHNIKSVHYCLIAMNGDRPGLVWSVLVRLGDPPARELFMWGLSSPEPGSICNGAGRTP